MKKLFFRKVLCVIISIAMLCSLAVLSANATASQKTFQNIDELRETVNQIFNENYDEFVAIAKPLVSDSNVPDEYITYYENCGPCSTAFQKILYDNNITVETQRPHSMYPHIFDFLRTSFSESPDKVSCIVIDTTYKQFITDNYTREGFDFEDMASDLPDVLVYEYGNKQQLEEQLSGMASRLSKTEYEKALSDIFTAEYFFDYIVSDMQSLAYNTTGPKGVPYSNKFIDDLRNNSGAYSVKTDNIPVLNSTTQEARKSFEYDTNGIYRCYLTSEELAVFSKGFTVLNQNGELLYGADSENEKLEPYNWTAYSKNNQKFLSTDGSYPVSMNIQNIFTGAVISLDLRAGEDTPVIYFYKVFKTALYGDVNGDSIVDVNDVTYLQKSIAGYSSATLTQDAQDVADVLKYGALNINNATEISKYIAELKDFDCGKAVYYSDIIKLGINPNYGYIDF